MKNLIKKSPEIAAAIWRKLPVEVVTSAVLCIYFFIFDAFDGTSLTHILSNSMFPIKLFFSTPTMLMFILSLNIATEKWCCATTVQRWYHRAPYYIAPLLFLPTLFIEQTELSFASFAIPIALSVFFLSNGMDLDNRAYAKSALDIIKARVVSDILVGVCSILLVIICASILFIFSIDFDSLFEVIVDNSLILSSLKNIGVVVYCVAMPAVFIYLYLNNRATTKSSDSKFKTLLVNKIMLPAIAIYSLILHIYILKIVLSWELPKGGVTYLVFAYIFTVMLTMLIRATMLKPKMNWIFDNFSYFTALPLMLFWVGTIYRVAEYGITYNRLVIIGYGAVLSFFVISFAWRKSAKFLYTALAMIIMSLALYAIHPHALKFEKQSTEIW